MPSIAFYSSTALIVALSITSGEALAARYDAIAIDDDIGGASGNGAYAVGQGPTKHEASRIAMSNCSLGGKLACAVKLTYDRCGAYASSHQTAGTGTGISLQAATSAALASCRDTSCHLVIADCVDAPLRPPK